MNILILSKEDTCQVYFNTCWDSKTGPFLQLSLKLTYNNNNKMIGKTYITLTVSDSYEILNLKLFTCL
jgi:hypothetical protein